MSNVTIRLATDADLPAINSIYNYYVIHSSATYQELPSTAEERADWYANHDAEHPITVAIENGEVIGWGSLSRFHPRAAYRHTVENSVYIRHDRLARGVGKVLLEDLIQRAIAAKHRSIIALISGDQEPSLRLHARFGFVQSAHLREVGRKFDRWLDVIYMQRML